MDFISSYGSQMFFFRLINKYGKNNEMLDNFCEMMEPFEFNGAYHIGRNEEKSDAQINKINLLMVIQEVCSLRFMRCRETATSTN